MRVFFSLCYNEKRCAGFTSDKLYPQNQSCQSFVVRTRYKVVTKFVLRKPVSIEYFENSAASTFGATHLDDKTLAHCLDSDAVWLFKAMTAYLQNPAR